MGMLSLFWLAGGMQHTILKNLMRARGNTYTRAKSTVERRCATERLRSLLLQGLRAYSTLLLPLSLPRPSLRPPSLPSLLPSLPYPLTLLPSPPSAPLSPSPCPLRLFVACTTCIENGARDRLNRPFDPHLDRQPTLSRPKRAQSHVSEDGVTAEASF